MALLTDSVIPDGIAHHPLSMSHTLFRFTFPFGGVRTTSAIAIDTSALSIEHQARQIFSHVTSHLSKQHILNLLREKPLQWKERDKSCIVNPDSDLQPFVLSPELYSLLSPFLKHTATQQIVNYNDLIELLRKDCSTRTSINDVAGKEMHFDILPDPYLPSTNERHSRPSALPPDKVPMLQLPSMTIATTGVARIPPSLEVTRIMSGYNTASKHILSQQKLEPATAIDCGHSSVVSTQPGSLLHKLHGLQMAAREKNMNWVTYKDNLESILECGLGGDTTNALEKEFEVVYPKIYNGVNIDLSVEEDPHAHLHSHLHTLHVIPVLRGLMAAGVCATTIDSSKMPQVITTTNQKEVIPPPSAAQSDPAFAERESSPDLSSLRGFANILHKGFDIPTLVKVLPTLYALNASKYLAALSKFDQSRLKLPLSALYELKDSSAIASEKIDVPRLVRDIALEVCTLLKDKTDNKDLKNARKVAKIMYHHPEQAQFKDLLRALQLIEDSYSVDTGAYIRLMRELFTSILTEDLLPSFKFLISQLATLAKDIEESLEEENSERCDVNCTLCNKPPESIYFELVTNQIVCFECYVDKGSDDTKLKAVRSMTPSTKHKFAEAADVPRPPPEESPQHATTTGSDKESAVPDTRLVGRHMLDWRDLFKGVTEVRPDHFKVTLAAVACLRHSQFVYKLSCLSNRNLDKVPLKAQAVTEGDRSASTLNALLIQFSKELCYLLKEAKKEWIKESPEAEAPFQEARQIAKLMYHRLEERNVAELLKILALLSTAFMNSNHQNHSWVKNFLWRLISTTLVDSASCDALRSVMCQLKDGADPPPPETTERGESASVLVSNKCSGCRVKIDTIAISTGDGAVLCCTCWWLSETAQEGAPLLVTAAGLSKVVPSIATSHLLAHQQNMLENVIGTRKAILPDDRHAVMSTSVHEYSLVHKSSRDSSAAVIKESLVRGGTGLCLEEVTSIQEVANKQHVAATKNSTKGAPHTALSLVSAPPLEVQSTAIKKSTEVCTTLRLPTNTIGGTLTSEPGSPSPLAAPDLEQSVETESACPNSPRQIFTETLTAANGEDSPSAPVADENQSECHEWSKVPSVKTSTKHICDESHELKATLSTASQKAVDIREQSQQQEITEAASSVPLSAGTASSETLNKLPSSQVRSKDMETSQQLNEIEKKGQPEENERQLEEKEVVQERDSDLDESSESIESSLRVEEDAPEFITTTPNIGDASMRGSSCVNQESTVAGTKSAPSTQGIQIAEDESSSESLESELSGTFEYDDEEEEGDKIVVKKETPNEDAAQSVSDEIESELCSSDSLGAGPTPNQTTSYESETTSITDDSGPTDRVTAKIDTGLAPRGQLVSFKITDSFTLESDHSLNSSSGFHMLSGHTNSVPLEISQELDSGSHASTTLSSRGPTPPSSVTMGSPDRPLFQTQSLTAFRSESNTAESLLLNSDLLPAEDTHDIEIETPYYDHHAFDRHVSLTASEVDVFKSIRKFDRTDNRHAAALPSVSEGQRNKRPSRGQETAQSRVSPKQVSRWPTTTANASRGSVNNSTSSVYDQASYKKTTPRQDFQSGGPRQDFQSGGPRQDFQSGGPNYSSPRFAQPLARQVQPWDRRENNASRTSRTQGSRPLTTTKPSTRAQAETRIADRLMMGESARPSNRRGQRVERWR